VLPARDCTSSRALAIARNEHGARVGGPARARGAGRGRTAIGREHRRRKLRGVRVGGLSKEPANNSQSLRVKPPKYRNSFSFLGSFAGYCTSFYDKCVDQPANNLQTTRNRKHRFAKCGK
jgi:hypothetical protein